MHINFKDTFGCKYTVELGYHVYVHFAYEYEHAGRDEVEVRIGYENAYEHDFGQQRREG